MPARRRARIPVLIYCEGVHDATFMKHLADLYGDSNLRNNFEIKTGTGGSPRSLVEKASRVVGAYEARIVKFDNDRGDDELQMAVGYSSGILACFCTPCIEATLLEILEVGKSYGSTPTQQCKERLHREYIAERDRSKQQKYQQLFPKDKLEGARLRVPQLDAMIRIFEHGDRWSS